MVDDYRLLIVRGTFSIQLRRICKFSQYFSLFLLLQFAENWKG